MSDLVTFLRARLDEDEAIANAAGRGHGWHYGLSDGEFLMDLWGDAGGGLIAEAVQPRFMEHIVRHDPTRVLADVATKRAIVDMHWQWADDDGQPLALCDACSDEWPCRTLRHLAAPYAGCEGYRSEWAP